MSGSDMDMEAAAHVASALGAGWVLDDVRFQWVKPWNYLLIQMNESEKALAFARKFNDDNSLPEDDQVLLSMSMFRIAIISYGKCYAESGKGRTSLDHRNVFKGNDDLKSIHERMMAIRNTFVAHNGDNEIDRATIAVRETPIEISIKHLYTVGFIANEFYDYQRVIAFCKAFLVMAINKHLDKVQNEIGKPILLG